MARLGLRDVEVWNMRWDWFVEREDGRIVLDVRCNEDYTTKSGESRMIGVSQEMWQELSQLREEGQVFYLPGATKTERRNTVERRLNDLVRPILAGYRKRAYELRRWAGSRVWTEQGPAAAKEFLGHASITTTERYYSKVLGQAHAVCAPNIVTFPAKVA